MRTSIIYYFIILFFFPILLGWQLKKDEKQKSTVRPQAVEKGFEESQITNDIKFFLLGFGHGVVAGE